MPASWTPDLIARIRAAAIEIGFALAGVAPTPAATSREGAQTAARFEDWIDHGRAGEMDYLKRRNEQGELLRTSAQTAIPWARSILVCALNYAADVPASIDPAPPATGWIARYAQSGDAAGRPADYHDDMLRRLRQVEAALLAESPETQTRCYVDTGPLLERDFAARAGIGWTGKNTCVLNQNLGSWLLLGVIVTSLPVTVEAEAVLSPDRCGSCTRCIDACPTDALIAPRQMDASLCIAYLTIEKKGGIPEELRPLIGRQVFGCDICQDVCPWNRKAAPAKHEDFAPRRGLINPSLSWLAQMDQSEFRTWFKGSPLERTKRHRLRRNVAVAMGNSADPTFIPQLQLWSQSEDPGLAESAQWALTRLPAPADILSEEPESAPEPAQTMGFLSRFSNKPDPVATAAPATLPEPLSQAKPITAVAPIVSEDGWWPQLCAFARYMASTEVHTYAFSVAANVILSLFPFIVLLLTLAQKLFHSAIMVTVIGEMLRTILPNNQDFIVRNMTALVHPHSGTKIFSVVMLLITSTGVFLPLEVALNNVWGVKENRNYLENQIVSLGLAAAVGALAMGSVALAAGQQRATGWIFFGHTDNIVFSFIAGAVLKLFAVIMSITLFFLIYWILPHRKIPAMAVLPTAVVVGLTWEVAKYLYVLMLPRLDFESVYGPFRVSVGLMMWAFISGLILLAGAHFSATRYTLRIAREAAAEEAVRPV